MLTAQQKKNKNKKNNKKSEIIFKQVKQKKIAVNKFPYYRKRFLHYMTAYIADHEKSTVGSHQNGKNMKQTYL